MKVYDWIVDYCYSRGLEKDEAIKVADNLVAQEETVNRMKDNPIESYPIQIHATLSLDINLAATSYIDENLPGAWFRNQFA